MKALWLATFAFLMASHTPVVAQQAPSPKPPVGVPAEAKFFNGKWYHVYLEQTPWKSARAKCTRAGGRLAVVPDMATQTFVKTLSKGLLLWLGASDEKVEGLWVWEDGSEMTYKEWGRGQPGNYKGREHWLAIGQDGVWVDLNDKDNAVGFICEWKAQ